MIKAALCIAVLVVYAGSALAGDLPNLKLTPGVARTDISGTQVCTIKWGKDQRHVTAAMKRQVFLSYGYSKLNKDPRCPCEIDHLVSRELGGADDVRNLWPQSYRGRWNAHMKDRLENRLHGLVCSGDRSLSDVQKMIVSDWTAVYRQQFVGVSR